MSLMALTDVVGLGSIAAGLTSNIMGGSSLVSSAGQEEALQGKLAEQEQAQIGLQRQQQTLDFNRQQRQLVRNAIQTKAQSKAAAVASGSQFGSGLKGGQAQISGQTGTYDVNLSQNYELGQKGLDIASTEANIASQIGQVQTEMSSAQGQMMIGSSLTGLGTSLIGNSTKIGQIGDYLTGVLNGGVGIKGNDLSL